MLKKPRRKLYNSTNLKFQVGDWIQCTETEKELPNPPEQVLRISQHGYVLIEADPFGRGNGETYLPFDKVERWSIVEDDVTKVERIIRKEIGL